MRIIELFAGIGACSKALENIGIDLEIVDTVEIDKYAIKSFNAIHNTNFKARDISKYNEFYKDIDIITHGSPCQDFSIAGKQEGGDKGSGTRSSLMYETIRIVEQIKPKYILWENVKNVLSKKHKHNFDNYINTLDSLGYNSYYKILNAKDYGVPQNRERVFTVSIRKDIDPGSFNFPKKQILKLRLKDILENEVDEKYYLSEEVASKYVQSKENNTNVIGNLIMDKWQDSMKRIYDIEKYSPAINTMQGGNLEPKIITQQEEKILINNNTKKGYDEAVEGDSVNLQYPNSKTRRGRVGHQVSQTLMAKGEMGVIEKNLEYRIRKLTPRECWRLMGFNDNDFEKVANIPMSNAQLYKQAGNSIVVKVLEKIFANLFKTVANVNHNQEILANGQTSMFMS